MDKLGFSLVGGAKRRFTLIELLVVLGIIAILAGMVMPALGNARASGQRANCINNKKQMIQSSLMYSSENSGMLVYRLEEKPYSYVLAGRSGGQAYLPGASLMCTGTKDDLNAAATNATGMINAVDWSALWAGTAAGKSMRAKYGRFVVKTTEATPKSVAYVIEKMKNPSGLVIYADTFLKRAAGDTESGVWSFVPDGSDDSFSGVEAYVTPLHLKQAVAAFGDGRAEALTPEQFAESGITKTLDAEMETVVTH